MRQKGAERPSCVNCPSKGLLPARSLSPPPRAALCCLLCPKARRNLLTLHHCGSWYRMLPSLLPHSFSLAAVCVSVCLCTLFSVITVYIWGIQFWNAEGPSLKQHKLKYGTLKKKKKSSLAFRRAKPHHSNSPAARGFQGDLKSGILEIGQFERCRSSGLWVL